LKLPEKGVSRTGFEALDPNPEAEPLSVRDKKKDCPWRPCIRDGSVCGYYLTELCPYREQIPIQVSGLLTDEVRELIEQVVRDEVRRILSKKVRW